MVDGRVRRSGVNDMSRLGAEASVGGNGAAVLPPLPQHQGLSAAAVAASLADASHIDSSDDEFFDVPAAFPIRSSGGGSGDGDGPNGSGDGGGERYGALKLSDHDPASTASCDSLTGAGDALRGVLPAGGVISRLYTVERPATYGEGAPDSGDLSLVKVARELLSAVKAGAELTNVPLPASVLDPVSSLEKGIKSMQRGELIRELVAAPSPTERFLQLVRFFLSGLPKERFGKKPYNPVLGEVFRAAFQHRDGGGTTVMLAEQVCHHPPMTALFLNNPTLGFAMSSHATPEPKLWGNSLEIKLKGLVRIALTLPGAGASGAAANGSATPSPRANVRIEEYVLTRPTILTSGYLGIGKQRMEFAGECAIRCEASGLEAVIDFKSKGTFNLRSTDINGVGGRVTEMATGRTLYEISGQWDRVVHVTDVAKRETSVLFDYDAVAEQYGMNVWLPPEEAREEHNSLRVWAACSKAIWAGNSKQANDLKRAVEDNQRALRKERDIAGVEWEPRYFNPRADGDGYNVKPKLVPFLRPEVRSVQAGGRAGRPATSGSAGAPPPAPPAAALRPGASGGSDAGDDGPGASGASSGGRTAKRSHKLGGLRKKLKEAL